jgi:hypothetical protein
LTSDALCLIDATAAAAAAAAVLAKYSWMSATKITCLHKEGVN